MNELLNVDCIDYMKEISDNSYHLSITDIPYGVINRKSNGLRSLDKQSADIMQFDLRIFLDELFRVTSGTIIIFCSKEQLSEIHAFFHHKQEQHLGTVRQLIWEKTNPSPMNGQHIYLSGIENAVWFKKRGGAFNAKCKNTVFRFPCGRSKIHPTEKNHDLLKELIVDNSNIGDIIFDPCAGSGSHLLVAKENGRNYIGCEINSDWHSIAMKRLNGE